jgi:DNA-binding transcriptional ArsR family regulator
MSEIAGSFVTPDSDVSPKTFGESAPGLALTVADVLGGFFYIMKHYGSQLFRYGFPDYHGTPTDISDNKMVSQEVFDVLYEANLIEKHRQERGWSLYALNLTGIGLNNRTLLRDQIQAIINKNYRWPEGRRESCRSDVEAT